MARTETYNNWRYLLDDNYVTLCQSPSSEGDADDRD